MAKRVLIDCFIEVNGINFSDHCNSVEVNLEKEEIDTTNFSGGGKERAQGLKDDSFTLNFQQDFDAAEVDATLYPLWNNGTEFVIKVRPTAAVVGVGNPEYSATCIMLKYMPLAGNVGELSETKVSFPAQRSGIARATA